MHNENRTKTLENYCRRLFRNVSRNGEWVNFSCPVAPYSPDHKYKADGSPSAGALVAFSGNVVWRCFTCKGQGPMTNLLRYLQTKSTVDYSEIINALNDQEQLPDFDNRFVRPSELVCEPLEFADLFDPTEKYPESSKYLADRGISPTTSKKLGLGFDPDNHRITFPVRRQDGKTYGFTGRTTLPGKDVPKIIDYYFPKSYFILGMEHWNKDYPVILVEGLFAFAKLHELSKGKHFPYNIGAIMGSTMSPEQRNLLIKFGKPVICMLDNDQAGKTGLYGKTPQADWHPKKKETERAKGMVFQLKEHLPTFIVRWPTYTEEVDGNKITKEKDDPDQLTSEELFDMLSKLRMIL